MENTLKIGLTGGIGSGKSIVSHLFQLMGYPTYDSDSQAKLIMTKDQSVKKKLIDLLGEKIYQIDQSLNRAYLSKQLFTNNCLLQKVNQIVHPAVFEDFNSWAEKSKQKIVFIESAILFETELPRFLDKTITVTAPIELRYKRVQERDLTSKEEVTQRINNQRKDTIHCEKSEFVIVNDDQHSIIQQCQKIISCLTQIKID